ncbi:M1-specific T cell receptor beta chain-like [Mugil cephalus]|uniref:M1-specific T cell receptor beta chain-like n=1 Tax=Mugil cephalus TaxID=48193 RepID=UPI001FB7E568|nr:M1-specific T cell receptor beta chain-like [Mugil cephalus]
MTSGVITSTFFILWVAGVSESVLIDQWPRYISVAPNTGVEMHCYQNETDHQYMYWYKQQKGKALELIVYLVAGGPTYEEGFKSGYKAETVEVKKSSLTISSVQRKDEAVYLCAASLHDRYEPAYFGSGTKLTVLEPGRNITRPEVKILGPSPKECKNKTLVCVASGFYPDHVTVSWEMNGDTSNLSVATDNNAQRDKDRGTYRITSRLTLKNTDWGNPDNIFNCTVSFFDGKATSIYYKSIEGVKGKQQGPITRKRFLRVSQSGKLCYGVLIFKSFVYGAFVAFFVWKLQKSAGKQD